MTPQATQTLEPIGTGSAVAPAQPSHLLPAPVALRPEQAAAAPARKPRRDVVLGRGARLALADVSLAGITLTIMLVLFGRAGDGILPVFGVATLALMCAIVGAHEHAGVCITKSPLDDVPLLVTLSALLTLTVTIASPLLAGAGLVGGQVGLLWIALLIALTCGRGLLSRLDYGLEPERCVVLGDLEQAERLRENLKANGTRASIVAAIPLSSEDLSEPEADLELVIRSSVHELGGQRVIVAPPDDGLVHTAKLLRAAKAVGVPVSLVPRLFESVGHSMKFDEINGMTLIGVRPFGLSRGAGYVKRAFDVMVACVLIVALSPILIAISVAVMLDSRGPILFKQVRVGRNGDQFRIFKFRSMVANAEARKDALRSLAGETDGLFKMTDDPRITRVGRFLRSSSLDELPQIFNVLRGEMSLVGPRPLVVDEDCGISGIDRGRLHLMPGMTGPWQILRKRVSRAEMVSMDYRYVAGWSLWLDLKILARTASHVAARRNV